MSIHSLPHSLSFLFYKCSYLVEDNDYAAIAAQSLYGDDFEVEMENQGTDLLSILNQAEVLEQRFSFALFAFLVLIYSVF